MAYKSGKTFSDGAIIGGLVFLSLVPVLAGSVRLVQIARGGPITEESARFLAAPVPAVLHIAAAIVFCIAGAWQFAPRFRARNLQTHRWMGRVLVWPAGMISALSGLWLVQFYPPMNHDGPILYGIRIVVGSSMALFLGLGLAAVLRRDVSRHRAWMMRSYALGIGAGTQFFTHLPLLFFPAVLGQGTRAAAMGAGWMINLLFVEYLLRRSKSRSAVAD